MDWYLLPQCLLVQIFSELGLPERDCVRPCVQDLGGSSCRSHPQHTLPARSTATQAPGRAALAGAARRSRSHTAVAAWRPQHSADSPPVPSAARAAAAGGQRAADAPRQPPRPHAATGLTQLLLSRVTVLGGSQQLGALSVLTGLRHLAASELQEPSLRYAALPSCLLSQLVQLTHLQVVAGLSDAALQHLSCLAGLRHLQLERLGADTTPAALACLDALQGLSCLWLEGAHFTLGDDTTPSLGALTGLHTLQLHACDGLGPGILSGLSNLRVLQLGLTPFEGGAEGTASFLALLPRLRQLTQLELHAALTHHAPGSAAAYSALTSGSRLASLQPSAAMLPAAAWQHVFPAQGRVLAQLKQLQLAYCDAPLTCPALQALAGCCPSIRSLALHGKVRLLGSPSPLLQLTGLTELSLSHVGDELAVAVLSRLTGLSALLVEPPSSITDAGVLQLTALRRLTYLLVCSEGLSRQLG